MGLRFARLAFYQQDEPRLRSRHTDGTDFAIEGPAGEPGIVREEVGDLVQRG